MTANTQDRRPRWWWIVTSLGLIAAGCGDNLDTHPDEVPMACTPTTAIYRLDHVDPAVVVAERLDLDGDGHADNALGHGHDLLDGLAPGFAIGPRFDARLADDVAWLLAIDTCDGEARVTLEQGVRVGGPPLLPRILPRAVGTLVDGALAVTDGETRIPLVALADAAGTHRDLGWRPAGQLAIEATVTDDVIIGVFAAALPTATVRTTLASPIADFLSTQPDDDWLRIAVDDDHDGVVSAEELATTTTYEAITRSDLDDQTSISFAFRATRIDR